jgi:hypothetical protein
MFKSLTTPEKQFGTIMHIIERILLTGHKLPPSFWTKKLCDKDKFNQNVYNKVGLLTQALRKVNKLFSDEVILESFNSLKRPQIEKINKLAGFYPNIGKLVSGFSFSCGEEIEKRRKLAAPKDDGEVTKINFDAGPDLRNNRKSLTRKSPWEILSGAIDGENEGSC